MMPVMNKAIRKFLSDIGHKGGSVTGASKLRGGKTEAERREYYARISRKAHTAKRTKAAARRAAKQFLE
jgi:general stress protein YciG